MLIQKDSFISGQSVLELLIALGVFAISVAAGFQLFFGSQTLSSDSVSASLATDYAREGTEAVQSIKNRNWMELSDGSHGLIFQNNYWLFGSSSTSDGRDIFTRTVAIKTLNDNLKIATTTITWQNDPLRTQKIELVEQLTKWQDPSQGGCKLGPLTGNWAAPRSLGSGDIGAGNSGTDVVVKLPYAYVSGTASSASKPDIFVFNVSDPTSPTLVNSLDIGADGINALFLKGNYLYAASANDNKELIIFDISNPPTITQVGSLNLPGTADGTSIVAFSNTVALGRKESSDKELYFINVADPTSPTVISSFEFDEGVNDLNATNDKLYVSSKNGSKEVGIFDITNPANPSLITYYSLGGEEGWGIGFQSPGNILLGRNNNKFTVLGATTTSQIYQRGSIDAGGVPQDIVCVAGNLAFLATTNSNKEFLIVNISNPDALVEYGSLNFPQVGTGIDFADNKVYMSVRSNDSLRIITSQ